MKINNVNVLITAIDKKENQNTHLPYWPISLVTLDGEGTAITINVKSQDVAEMFTPMKMYYVNLSLSNSQYGMRLEFADIPISKELGAIGSQSVNDTNKK